MKFARTHPIHKILGDRSLSLGLRGIPGGLSKLFHLNVLAHIGLAQASFIYSSSSIFVAALASSILGQRASKQTWLCILGSMVGLVFLLNPNFTEGNFQGRLIALLSAILASLAYLFIARGGRKNSSHVVIFYFCLVTVAIHVATFIFFEPIWPDSWKIWGLLILVGLSAAAAQYFLTYGLYRWQSNCQRRCTVSPSCLKFHGGDCSF